MKSIDMGAVWDRATEFLGDNIAVVMPIALAFIFLPASITDNIAPLGASGSALQLPISLIDLLLSLVSMLGQLAIIALALDLAETSGGAVQVGARRLFTAFLFMIVLVLILIIAFLPVIGLAVFAGVDPAAMAGKDAATVMDLWSRTSPATLWAAVIYVFAWMLGAIWISARLTLGFPVMIAEERGLSALGRSFALTKWLALKIVGVLLLYFIVSAVAGLAAKAAFGGIIRLLIGDSGQLSLAGVLISIAVGAVAMAFTVLQAAFVAKLYVAARARAPEDSLSQ